ncbi:hypothetical protein [Vibrio campbellii]|uniref:hypothetical protein n=1 Tax=Vibrio campbellii TaxID=680 RepID=UPI0039B75573
MGLELDSFIGTKLSTPKNGILTVVGRSVKNPRKYIVHCSICSPDREMFREELRMERVHLMVRNFNS